MKEREKRSFHGTEIMNGNACLGVSEIKILLKKKKKKHVHWGWEEMELLNTHDVF